jgi:hypothetical protein
MGVLRLHGLGCQVGGDAGGVLAPADHHLDALGAGVCALGLQARGHCLGDRNLNLRSLAGGSVPAALPIETKGDDQHRQDCAQDKGRPHGHVGNPGP